MGTPLFNGLSAEQAAQNQNNLKRYLDGMTQEIANIRNVIKPVRVSLSSTAPSQGAAGVTGQDGVFLVTLSPSTNASGAQLLYQLETSDTLAFDSAGHVITYGGTSGIAQTDWRLHEANKTRYVRWRSKTSGSAWSSWTYYNLPAACGPYAVWSGVLRSIATALVNQAMTPSGGNPLTQVGTSTAIAVAASQWKAGSQKISYNPGTVDPGAYGVYYVFCDDPTRAGGTVVFESSVNVDDVTANDYRVYFGKITTVGGGGGIGGGGGSGGCLTGEVEWETKTGKIASKDLRKGDRVISIDGGEDEVISVEIIPNMPCFELETENGFVLRGASSSHKLKYNFGPFETVFELQVGDLMQTRTGASALKRKDFLGNRTVYKIGLHRTRVGYTDGFVSHNMLAK